MIELQWKRTGGRLPVAFAVYGWILVLAGFWAIEAGASYLDVGLYMIALGVGVVGISHWIRRSRRRENQARSLK